MSTVYDTMSSDFSDENQDLGVKTSASLFPIVVISGLIVVLGGAAAVGGFAYFKANQNKAFNGPGNGNNNTTSGASSFDNAAATAPMTATAAPGADTDAAEAALATTFPEAGAAGPHAAATQGSQPSEVDIEKQPEEQQPDSDVATEAPQTGTSVGRTVRNVALAGLAVAATAAVVKTAMNSAAQAQPAAPESPDPVPADGPTKSGWAGNLLRTAGKAALVGCAVASALENKAEITDPNLHPLVKPLVVPFGMVHQGVRMANKVSNIKQAWDSGEGVVQTVRDELNVPNRLRDIPGNCAGAALRGLDTIPVIGTDKYDATPTEAAAAGIVTTAAAPLLCANAGPIALAAAAATAGNAAVSGWQQREDVKGCVRRRDFPAAARIIGAQMKQNHDDMVDRAKDMWESATGGSAQIDDDYEFLSFDQPIGTRDVLQSQFQFDRLSSAGPDALLRDSAQHSPSRGTAFPGSGMNYCNQQPGSSRLSADEQHSDAESFNPEDAVYRARPHVRPPPEDETRPNQADAGY